MNQNLIYVVAGARPNFMKIAPFVRAIRKRGERFQCRIIHTGQHYDREMSDIFFEELGIPRPDYHLECGGGSHAEQSAKVMIAFERLCIDAPPQCVVVVGDVNSTLACSIAAKKLGISVAHIEAGLRSRDMGMPEEINRIVTDSICDWYFCTEQAGVDNLLAEGKSRDRVFHVGHVMVDNLLYQQELLATANKSAYISASLKKEHARYGIVTLHRPSNVDNKAVLGTLINTLDDIAEEIPLIFPMHPRTRDRIKQFGITTRNLILTSPLSYMDFLNLWSDAVLVLTDSGGLQEETTALLIPCLTLRENTERPVTVSQGTNTLVGNKPERILNAAMQILSGKGKTGSRPELWDGYASERIVLHLDNLLPQ